MNWELVRDVAIPVASILIPSLIAIGLARAERNAAKADRAAERLNGSIEASFAAIADLMSAAYTNDFREAATDRLRAASRLERIEYGIRAESEPVWDWITEELSVIARGLEDVTELGLPVLMEQIVWRGANFSTVISKWRRKLIDDDWFRTAEHPSLAETMSPEDADAADAV